VYINLVGHRAQTGMTPLKKRWHNSFERGKIDEFTIESKLGGLGELRGVVVRTDSTGLNPNWLLEKVVVTPPELPSGVRPLPVAFRADRWLGKSKGEGDTETERCTAELLPAPGAAQASLASAQPQEQEPEPVLTLANTQRLCLSASLPLRLSVCLSVPLSLCPSVPLSVSALHMC
jgi:hypothetical protein